MPTDTLRPAPDGWRYLSTSLRSASSSLTGNRSSSGSAASAAGTLATTGGRVGDGSPQPAEAGAEYQRDD